ncbi:hypothetical protein B0T10DRAFT_471334 [Thelonectria olida]|uniref:Uncharacterized protein n=1 Tax=Thelonectria olida TaxID=1576542 RepID=A0A9P8WIJ6_9HYPO|nr:hypothetical protein B0T10DRAFT_471334 [Thelonectria olida]
MSSLWSIWCFNSRRFLAFTVFAVIVVLIWTASPIDSIKDAYEYVSIPDFATTKTSRLHYLIPASQPKLNFCANVISVLANRYPIPVMLGYKGEGEFDAKATHLAKVRAIHRYLHTLPSKQDDDLVIVVDGYDVLAQLPAEAMIERYFEIVAMHDRHLADRYGLTVDEAHARGMRQSVIWGADKGCYPPMWDQPQCWALPPSFLPHNVYGRSTHDGALQYNDPVFINAGTAMGPVSDLRLQMDHALMLINNTYNEDFKYKNSDQYYMGKLLARQETSHTKALTGGTVPGLKGSRWLPPAADFDSNITDLHMAIDYESAFTCTQCGNEGWMRNLQFKNPDNTALMDADVGQEKESFKPFPIQMPGNVRTALVRLYESIVHDTPAEEWIRKIKLGTNVATGQIYGIYHGTCNKNNFKDRFKALWLYADARALLRAATEAFHANRPLAPRKIDGRYWVAPKYYPKDDTLYDPLGGVYTDYYDPKEQFIPLGKLCSAHLYDLFGN